jgi:thiol-disulfide isomerase/thioredoxin
MFTALVLAALLSQIPTPERPPMVGMHPPASFKLTVYVFVTTDCPISNRYAPELQRLAAKFALEASFILVYPVRADTEAMIREHRKKYGYTLQSVRDADLTLVKMTRVTMLPEVAVLQGNTLRYRGRIDDRWVDLGQERARATQHDLEDALTAITSGKPVATRETRAVGCYLPDLVK